MDGLGPHRLGARASAARGKLVSRGASVGAFAHARNSTTHPDSAWPNAAARPEARVERSNEARHQRRGTHTRARRRRSSVERGPTGSSAHARRTNLDDSTAGTDRVVRTRAGAWAPGSSSAPGNSTATTRRPLVAAPSDGRVRRARRTSAADDDPASTEPLTDPAAASVLSSPRTTRRRRSPIAGPTSAEALHVSSRFGHRQATR